MSAEVSPSPEHVLQTWWGYNAFRPWQREAIDAVLSQQDSVVVLPTGGGKSLCFQVPAVMLPGLAVVVSPLISLMKDQVDALTELGIPAAAVHSALSNPERLRIADQLRAGQLKLLYVAPERLCTERMIDFLRERPLAFIAVDEAHCISSWGHDFRSEYRQLGQLRTHFPGVAVHAYTATATETVRRDIAEQLALREPAYLVGNFDRPNLHYRVRRRESLLEQVLEVLAEHPSEAGVIYCQSRKDVDGLTAKLTQRGIRAAAYHAGMSDEDRHRHQEAFVNDEVDVIVATIAFGMGIDKSNVRFVIHTAAPKSLENYQQETGRAGRDGLPADCVMFYGGNDFVVWRKMHDQLAGDALAQVERNLQLMERYCASVTCRHRSLVNHFGQEYAQDDCSACDVCCDQAALLDDALVTAQKILSCVVRVEERYGADYVAQVLIGSEEQKVLDRRHDRLSTYGLLKAYSKAIVRDWIEQLASQGFLDREGEYRILTVTPSGWEVLQGGQTPRLLAPPERKAESGRSLSASKSRRGPGGPFDEELFAVLRRVRRQLADERGVPPFIVFADTTLQDLARQQPTTPAAFRQVHGVGEQKAARYADVFLAAISEYLQGHAGSSEASPVTRAASS